MPKPVYLLSLVVALALVAPASAQRSWSLLGEREVNDRVDRDVIAVGGSRRFNQIRICTARHAVRFLDVDVRFRNGGNQDVAIRSVIAPGRCSRTIDLNARNRDIASVAFTYEAASLGRARAHVRLFGR